MKAIDRLDFTNLERIHLRVDEQYTPEEIERNRAAWLTALRSERFPQGRANLVSEDGALCCLGVASVLCDNITIVSTFDGAYSFSFGERYTSSAILLIKPLQEALGVTDADPWVRDPEPGGKLPRTLTDLNDLEGLDFKVIAEYLEQDVFPRYPIRSSQ